MKELKNKTKLNYWIIKNTEHGKYTILIDKFFNEFETAPYRQKDKILKELFKILRPKIVLEKLIEMDCRGDKQEFRTDGNPEPYESMKKQLNYPGNTVLCTCPKCNEKIKVKSMYLRFIRDVLINQLTRCAHCKYRHDCYTRLITKMFLFVGIENKKIIPRIFLQLLLKTLFRRGKLIYNVNDKNIKESMKIFFDNEIKKDKKIEKQIIAHNSRTHNFVKGEPIIPGKYDRRNKRTNK